MSGFIELPLAYGAYDVDLFVNNDHCDGQRLAVNEPVIEALIMTQNIQVASSIRSI